MIAATPDLHPTDPLIDRAMHAILEFPNSVTAELKTDLRLPGKGPFGLYPGIPIITSSVRCEGGGLDFYNFVMPTIYHSVTVKPRSGKRRVEKIYEPKSGIKGEASWTT